MEQLRFLILPIGSKRPDVERVIFCDGAGGRTFREGFDLDLSHWRPNRTPPQYRAGTSTEICFRFLDAPIRAEWTLALNNHLDVDGILSVYTLVHSAHARKNQRVIIEAAEMGDFWGWGQPLAARLFQGLTFWLEQGSAENRAAQAIYEEAFARIPGLIDGTDADVDRIDRSLEPMVRGIQLVEQGAIGRSVLSPRFTHYELPASIVDGDIDRATCIPRFNEAISTRALLWPESRAKWDSERACLVSVESAGGWRHDLWFPGYLWADTDNRWVPTGMNFGDRMESYDLNNPALDAAVRNLNEAETGVGRWTLGVGGSELAALIQRQFPVVLRVLDSSGAPAASSLSPKEAANLLQPALDE